MDQVLTDDDLYDAIEHLLSTHYPRIWDQVQSVDQDQWEEDVQSTFKVYSQDFGSQSTKDSGLLEVAQEHGLTRDDVVDLIEREANFRQGGGRPAKVDYWVEELESADDVTYDLPWPDDEHEMAIRSSATLSKLKERLE